MIEYGTDISAFWQAGWQTLSPGNLVGLSSTNQDGTVHSRTVVLRASRPERGELRAYTDRRSTKAVGMNGTKRFHWLHWDEEASIQFAGSGSTGWLGADKTDQLFASLPVHGLRAYATVHPPGSPLPSGTNDLPDWWDPESITPDRRAEVRQHFGVLVTHLDRVDLLYLSREANIRMQARKQGDEWTMQWVTP